MKKFAVLTLSNSINYGGILQSVALNTKLKSFGVEPVFIKHQKMPEPWLSMKDYVKNRIELYGKDGISTKIRIVGGMAKTFLSNRYYFDRRKKIKTFQAFINENLNTTKYYESVEELKKACMDFDTYIVGSDQVWNNAFTRKKFDMAYFLTFAGENSLKYSYAASAGGQKTDEYVSHIIEYTKDFSGISVREKSLEKHMQKLGCKRVTTVLDPTLLLSKDEWISMENKPAITLPEKYILVYYLERTSYNDAIIKIAAEQLGLPVVNILPDRKRAEYDCINDYTAGPGEFIHYFHNASYVITNSFHAIVFSLIFGKKFAAVPREGQESRVEDLLKIVNLENRIISDESSWEVINEDITIDIESLLKDYRNHSVEFLNNLVTGNEI